MKTHDNCPACGESQPIVFSLDYGGDGFISCKNGCPDWYFCPQSKQFNVGDKVKHYSNIDFGIGNVIKQNIDNCIVLVQFENAVGPIEFIDCELEPIN